MPSTGPQLPPHLTKRKRDGEDDDLYSPPRKIGTASPDRDAQPRRVLGPSMPPQPAKNEEEINVDDSDSDDAGPAPPPTVGPAGPSGPTRPSSPPRRTVGPSMPPAGPMRPASPKRPVEPTMPPASNNEEIALGVDSDSDDMGPAPPRKGPTAPPAAAPPPRRVMGPAPPPAPLDQMPSQPANAADLDDSDDDDYGPSLPPAPGSAAAHAYEAEKAQERAVERKEAAQPKKLQRADWMLVPPSDSDWGSRLDPTKLKNRKFASGKAEKAPTGGISAIWTETPEQKRQRLEDEVLGRKDAATAGPRPTSHANDGEQEAIARRIRQYNEANRGKSLVEQHMGSKGNKEEDDPSKRAFDHEKDMALGGLMTGKKKADMLAKAGNFGSRFERGKFL